MRSVAAILFSNDNYDDLEAGAQLHQRPDLEQSNDTKELWARWIAMRGNSKSRRPGSNKDKGLR